MDYWDDIDFGKSGTDDLDLAGGLGDIIGSVLSFLVFVSPVSWIGEKLKQIFRVD